MAIAPERGKRYNFNTLAPGILGQNYKRAKCVGLLTYEQAITVRDNELHTLHEQVYSTLPSNTPMDIRLLTFTTFELPDGKQMTLADAWIDSSTFVETSATNVFVTVRDVTTADITVIADALAALGYINVDVTAELN